MKVSFSRDNSDSVRYYDAIIVIPENASDKDLGWFEHNI